MKKILSALLLIAIFSGMSFASFAENETNYKAEYVSGKDFSVDAASAYLIEASTGTVLFSQNSDEKRSPASVTKIMTLLLIMEAVEEEKISLTDKVSVSLNAASMGGSQVFLEEGEIMTVDELIKCTVIASANDAAVALAEHIAGSEEAFVNQMNMKAKEMGLKNTAFENVTGLDDTTTYHLTSAEDIGIMSCALVKYPLILKYASLWQDTIRNGEFTLTNTNRLVRYYNGCNGLKTGSTDKAGYCVSVSAVRNDMHLIAVIMGAETKEARNSAAKAMLDYGFANYSIYKCEEAELESVKVSGGTVLEAKLYSAPFSCVVPKSALKKVEASYEIPEKISAPLTENQKCGKIIYKIDGEVIGECDIIIKENIDMLDTLDIFTLILKKILYIS